MTPTHNTALIMAAQGAALPDAKGDHLAILKKVRRLLGVESGMCV